MKAIALFFLLLSLLSCGKHETRRPYLDDRAAQGDIVEILTPEAEALKAIRLGDEMSFFSLLDSGSIDVNDRHEKGVTYLIEAVLWERIAFVERLIAHEHIDLELRDDEGMSAYDHAVRIDHRDLMRLLSGDQLSQEEINQALFDALYGRNHEAIQNSLDQGAELNIHDEKGMTPLIVTLFQKDERAARLLLQTRKVDLNFKDLRRRWPPLTWAKRQGLTRLAQMLERLGAQE